MKTKDHLAASVHDLRDGQMKQIQVAGTPILLARVGDKFYALAAACPHYGAPLAEGALDGQRLICPWHHSCFHLETGALLEPPALDSLPGFPVHVVGEKVIITLPAANVPDRRRPPLADFDPGQDPRTFAIVGAGAAGMMAAQTLREDGFHGRIVLISQEERLPYDRPNLSKDYLAGAAQKAWMDLRPQHFYDELNIERRSATVHSVDARHKVIHLEPGPALTCAGMILCTGGLPRKLEVPGSDLPQVLTLRSYDDADRLIALTESAQRIVLVGSGFIAMEAAAALRQRGKEVSIVSRDSVPFERTLGPEVGRVFQKLHEEQGVELHLKRTVARVMGNGRVEAVELDNGVRIEAQVVLAALGIVPNTAMLSGVDLHQDGSVNVDLTLEAAPGVYACGDIARFPDWRNGQMIRVEHWRLAQQHGRLAAGNLLGRQQQYRGIPFFWTTQFDLHLRYLGHASRWDEVILQGNVGRRKFLAYYVAGGQVLAAAGVAHDYEMAQIEELMRQGRLQNQGDLPALARWD